MSFSTYADDWNYTIKSGDTIWALTRDKLIDPHAWSQMLKGNSIAQPKKLIPGTEISFPLELVKKAEIHATVINAHGDTQLFISNSSSTPLKSGMLLSSGDRITTGPLSSVLLLLEDDSRIIIQANSELILSQVQRLGGENSEALNFDVELLNGEIEMNANPNHSSDSRFLINTPIANTAVRGTKFQVQSGPNASRVSVFNGKVDVGNALGSEFVPQNKGTMAEQDKPPIKPVTLLPEPQNDLVQLVNYLPHTVNLTSETDKTKGYRVQASKTDDYTEIVFDETVGHDFVLDERFLAGSYFFKMRAIDGNGIEGRSLQQKITVELLPDSSSFQYPEAEITKYVGEHQFSWVMVNNAESYLFEVAKDSEFTSLIYSENNKKTQVDVSLDKVGMYFYRITGLTKDGKHGKVSETQSISLVSQPKSPVITAQSSDETTLRLSWNAMPSDIIADHYQIELSPSDAFESNVMTLETQTRNWTSDRPKVQDYYARVRVMDSLGEKYGPYSLPVKFTMPLSNYQFKTLF